MCIIIHTQIQKNEANSNAFSKITHQREHIVIPTQFNAIETKSKHKSNLSYFIPRKVWNGLEKETNLAC